MQQGQVFQLKRTGRDGEPQWAYRYRAGGRDSKRVQRGGFASERDATDALERALEPRPTRAADHAQTDASPSSSRSTSHNTTSSR